MAEEEFEGTNLISTEEPGEDKEGSEHDQEGSIQVFRGSTTPPLIDQYGDSAYYKVSTRSSEDHEQEGGEEIQFSNPEKVVLITRTPPAQVKEENKNTSSIGGASFNFINSIIGSGIIGIPSAVQQSGFLFGVVLLMIVAMITDYTVILLVKNGHMANKFSYQEMVTAAFGRPGYWYLTFVQFLFPFFAMAGYIVIVGDTISPILHQIFSIAEYNDPPSILTEPRDVLIKVTGVLLVMLPLSMLRNVSKLEKFSAFAVFCIVFIVTVTIYEATHLYCAVRCYEPDLNDSVLTTWFINKSFVQGIGIMGSAFVCHHNTYLIYGSLSNRSVKRFSIVSHISVSSSFVFCVILGLSGFLTFLDRTQGDLFNNFCGYDPVANTARFLFACVIMLTFPIECFVAREVLEISLSYFPRRFIEGIKIEWLKKALKKFLFTARHQSLIRHIVLTLLVVFSTLMVGSSTNDLGVVLAFNGCFTAVPLAFILPTACFLKLSDTKWFSLSKIMAFLVMLFGIAVMVIGTVLAITEAVQSYLQNAELYKPTYCPAVDAFHNETCCQLFEATGNFSSSIALCDCTALCPDYSQNIQYLSSNYCNLTNFTDYYY